ncbi:hydantoinase B/oxoprolinase family protein [Streptosporangium subroseum]|uniref:hydantoinase B/oxoprolinase family protein n=1 Tax=Streptosporangium subroseum TaxID=106412 RepID=UPI00343F48D4
MSAAIDIDGVRLAVVTNRLQSIARSMMNTVLRTGRSGVLNSARDFSCCILTGRDELLAAADSLPIHVMSGPDLMARVMRELHDDIAPGDAFLHNSPYLGNSHAADHSFLVPVFDDEGAHRFTVLVKAHQADCGNSVPTTYMATAADVYEEGALIFPCVRVQRDYRDIADILRMCEVRIRVPDQWRGDYLAAMGAARIGERKLRELAADVGWDTLDELAEQWFDYSERRMRSAIGQLSSGTIEVTSHHDAFPGLPEGLDLRIRVSVDAAEETIEVDLRENPDCQPCGLNLTESTSRTAAMVGVFNGLHDDIPLNSGAFRRLRILLRENCVVGIPRHPASCSVATTNVADRVACGVQRALAELCNGAGQAEAGYVIPPADGVISGHDEQGPFVNQIFLGLGGGAGSPYADGWFTAAHVGNSGLTLLDSVEMDEARFPIRVYARALLPDSEGAGEHRGAPGALVEFGPVGSPLTLMYAQDGYETPALGARGGEAGGLARQWKVGADGTHTELDPVAQLRLDAGERVLSHTSGGGGYGPPLARSPERVAHDVREGWISRERAREVYGVVLDVDGAVDVVATTALRDRLWEAVR